MIRLFFLAISYLFWGATTVDLKVDLSTTAAAKGKIYLALYDSPEDFSAKKSRKELTVSLGQATQGLSAVLSDLPSGKYVVAAFHDLDGDRKLDRNFFGIPTEPYGFSREPASKWKAPGWADIATQIDPDNHDIQLVLKTWKERQ